MTEWREWNVLGSGRGYYAQIDMLSEDFKVGPWSTQEKAQAYIAEHKDDSLETIRLFQHINFEIAHGNG